MRPEDIDSTLSEQQKINMERLIFFKDSLTLMLVLFAFILGTFFGIWLES